MRVLFVILFVLLATPAWAENLSVYVTSALAQPNGFDVEYTACPSSALFCFQGSLTSASSSSSNQINTAIINDAKTKAAANGIVVGGSDVVKVFGGAN